MTPYKALGYSIRNGLAMPTFCFIVKFLLIAKSDLTLWRLSGKEKRSPRLGVLASAVFNSFKPIGALALPLVKPLLSWAPG
jgi:hypothetical protein